METKFKPHINVVFLGHVDSGKSTTAGHFLKKCGLVGKKLFEKISQEAKDLGKQSFKYAYVFDRMKNERERGLTQDFTSLNFETENKTFTLVDAPGHTKYMKNMISAMSQADAVVLVVDATVGTFEKGFKKQGKIRELAIVASAYGAKQMIVLVNKMDVSSVDYSQARFNRIKDKMNPFLLRLGYHSSAFQFVPISAWLGQNLTELDTQSMGWYTGPTLYQALERLQEPKRATDQPLRLVVKNKYKIMGVGTVVTGIVASGTIARGTKLILAPPGYIYEAKSIECDYKPIKQAQCGQFVSINLKMLHLQGVSRGMILGNVNEDPPCEVLDFTARIFVFNHPTQIRPGYEPVIDCHTAHVTCKIDRFLQKINKNGRLLEKSPTSLRTGDHAIVHMIPLQPFCAEPYHKIPTLGRIIIRDMSIIVGIGIIQSINKRGNSKKTSKKY
ncbi:translation factor [Anaeramoeba flamelloides]|uniref:Translation factor n=1 Tax=Anaeramoeba flamelloides TaxID=1746091 RepID=A0ABQ8XY09_9EUKA|nr:translation factor [Anaeramoeba flamelloides]